MKKTITFLAALCMTVVANATILRVSNVTGSSAPYSTIEDAMEAATTGDTIMLDPSAVQYGLDGGRIVVKKPLTIMGLGYWLMKNGIISEGASEACLNMITIQADSVTLEGIDAGKLYIQASKASIIRCIVKGISFRSAYGDELADNCIVHQCFIKDAIGTAGGTGKRSSFHQFTNNIFTTWGDFGSLTNCYIAYNIFRTEIGRFPDSYNNTVKYNISSEILNNSNNKIEDNVVVDIDEAITNSAIDSDYYNLELLQSVMNTHGAFAGTDPYVISGVPSGPVITDMKIPTTLEVGNKLNVTIKVDVSR